MSQTILDELDTKRAFYFISWAMGLMVNDKKAFERLSVTELIKLYYVKTITNKGKTDVTD